MKNLIKYVILLISACLFSQSGINYKAVIKDGDGNPVSNTLVQVQLGILEGVAQTNVYTESHSPTTDVNGLIILVIGDGSVVSGIYADINWGSDDHFLNVHVNTGGGLVDLGTTQLLNVPYALQAAKANIAENVKGLEPLDEGNGIGHRIIGRDTTRLGNIGLNATDVSTSPIASSTYGATGESSFAANSQTTAQGSFATAFGLDSKAYGNTSAVFGFNAIANGYDAVAMGAYTNADASQSLAIGRYNVGGGATQNWIVTDPVFEIGIGLNNANRVNALTVFKNGIITAPSFDISEITNDKALITKEYADLNFIASGLETLDEGNGQGWRLKGRNPTFYSNLGNGAVDFSSTYSGQSTNCGASGSASFATGVCSRASGDYSTALGFLTDASGVSSTSMGSGTNASGSVSVAMGGGSTASGLVSTAFGTSTLATGDRSTAMGISTRAEALSSTSLGRYNVGGGNPSLWVSTDPLFEIGNGTSSSSRSNALTILKNGEAFIAGTVNVNENSVSGSSAVLRANGAEAIWYNGTYFSWGFGGSANYFQDFVGIGDTTPDAALDVVGDIHYTGTITDVSDVRLKENFHDVENALAKLQSLNGYSYSMIGDVQMQREYGVVAQEVQKVFPEMVRVIDQEKGHLGVSYSQLIPVLIEAIKEQQEIIEKQSNKMTEMSSELTSLRKLESRIIKLEIDSKSNR